MSLTSRCEVHKLDVTNEDSVNEISQYVTNTYGQLDLLINSAGMLHPSGRGETSLRDVSFQVCTGCIFCA